MAEEINQNNFKTLLRARKTVRDSEKMLGIKDRYARRLALLSAGVQQEKLDKAEEVAERDPLTGLLNRRGMERKISERVAREKRKREERIKNKEKIEELGKFAVFYLDLNNLGQINNLSEDQHTAGDRVLRELAEALNKEARPDDIIARVGGDEFIIILDSTDLESAIKYWERKNKDIKEKNGEINGVGAIWVSAGLAEANLDEIYEKLQVADKALRLAKNESKKRSDVVNLLKTESDL